MEYSPVPNQRRVTIHKVDQAPFYTKIDPASCKQAMGGAALQRIQALYVFLPECDQLRALPDALGFL